jgi:hypothetical protein
MEFLIFIVFPPSCFTGSGSILGGRMAPAPQI